VKQLDQGRYIGYDECNREEGVSDLDGFKDVIILLYISKRLTESQVTDVIEGGELDPLDEVDGAVLGRGGDGFGLDEVDEPGDVFVYGAVHGPVLLAGGLVNRLASSSSSSHVPR